MKNIELLRKIDEMNSLKLVKKIEQLESENEQLRNALQESEGAENKLFDLNLEMGRNQWNVIQKSKQLESENESLKNDYRNLHKMKNEILEKRVSLQEENEWLWEGIELAKDALEPYADNDLIQTAFKYLDDAK